MFMRGKDKETMQNMNGSKRITGWLKRNGKVVSGATHR
jgi:hypothetical protein